ncbi:hypothetical protein ACJ72_00386 [Emergomyces africanus]|uniref:Uncharacterized protein n=1 Tax=Emergomyces africanus TaxID=1955775 RepID=A0A1B7P866_9EURO|nr:hypothetical protein ACJ72_00386 [Emergomyces africanus]
MVMIGQAGRRETLQEEAEAYRALVEDGGRPSHPFNIPGEIHKNPGEFRELLSFWDGGARAEPELLFRRQRSRWKDFRKFQQFIRERNTDDERIIYIYSGHAHGEQKLWTNFINYRQRLAGEEGLFPIYARAMKARLLKHGFTRTFQLDEDPTGQDLLTTWIEYLGYEYWWYDRFAISDCQQKLFDRKWKDVIDSQVLEPSETHESVRGFGLRLLLRNELEQSQEAVKIAKSIVILTQEAISDSQNLGYPLKEFERKLQEAQSELAAAEKKCAFRERRSKVVDDFFRGTANYYISRDYAERHTILLRWILEQFPMVELEMKQFDTVVNTPNDEGKLKKLDQTAQLSSREGPRDQEINIEHLTALDCQTPTATPSQGNKGPKRSHDIANNEEQSSKRPRR